jgi:hypothetical protein
MLSGNHQGINGDMCAVAYMEPNVSSFTCTVISLGRDFYSPWLQELTELELVELVAWMYYIRKIRHAG